MKKNWNCKTKTNKHLFVNKKCKQTNKTETNEKNMKMNNEKIIEIEKQKVKPKWK